MNFDTSRIIDSNGQKYQAGWDEHGWFSIIPVEENPHYDVEPDSGPQWVHATDAHGNKYPVTSFTRGGAEELVAAIEED